MRMWWTGEGKVGLLLSVILCNIHRSISQNSVFSLTKSQLDTLIQNKEFGKIRNVLRYEGALGITDLGSDYEEAVAALKSSAPECLKDLRYPEFLLPDGSIRTTFARESGESTQYPSCLSKTGSTISHHFDNVFDSLNQLFGHLTGKDSLKWRSEDGQIKTFSQLPNKEHIHVYHGSSQTEEKYAAPFHTDNGILLLITPFQQHPLQIKSVGGQIIDTSTLDNSAVLILIARGLPDWLLRGSREGKEFRAAPHAVETLAPHLQHRTVFARMMVAPLTAQPVSENVQKVNFGQVFFNNINTQSDLCIAGDGDEDVNSRVPRDADQHQGHQMAGHEGHKMSGHEGHQMAGHDMKNKTASSYKDLKDDECSDPNTSYCWMGCLELPGCGDQETTVCTNSVGMGCCTDPSQEGTGSCADMDPTCQWKCSAPTTSPATPHTSHQMPTDKFCTGSGTDMYMNGFQVSGKAHNPCIMLFFNSWILDTRTKFAFGCIGVIILGIAVEGLLCVRRLLQSRKILRLVSSPVRRGGIIGLFGLNIAAGYLAMLVAMTYSVELFICMVIGLVIGHGIFNTSAPVGESVDPCCASQVIGASNHSQGSDSSHMKISPRDTSKNPKSFENGCFCSEGLKMATS